VDFLIDTGATTTALHPQDAIFKVGIDPFKLLDASAWPIPLSVGGIGGSCDYYPATAQYLFYDQAGSWQVEHGQIAIAQFRLDNQAHPSLLGWDLLERFRLSTDWPSRFVSLEKI
jgi:hypothetical protein